MLLRWRVGCAWFLSDDAAPLNVICRFKTRKQYQTSPLNPGEIAPGACNDFLSVIAVRVADWFQQSGSAAANGRVSKPNMSLHQPRAGECSTGSSFVEPQPTMKALKVIGRPNVGLPKLYRLQFADLQEPGSIPAEVRSKVSRDEDLVPEELLSGVENLQVFVWVISLPADEGGYGPNRLNLWLSADEVPDWNLVIASCALPSGFSSPDNADIGSLTPEPFELVAPRSRLNLHARLRQVFLRTSTIRNSQAGRNMPR